MKRPRLNVSSLLQSLGRKPKPPTLPPEDQPPALKLPPVIDVTDASFDETVMSTTLPAVVDFWAEWCGPCDTMSAYVGFLAQDYADKLLVMALDVDENPATAERFDVMGLPTLLFLRDGVEIDRQVGLLTYDELKAKVERVIAG